MPFFSFSIAVIIVGFDKFIQIIIINQVFLDIGLISYYTVAQNTTKFMFKTGQWTEHWYVFLLSMI